MEEMDQSKSPFKIDIPWDPDPAKVDYNKIFFDHFFPDLTGKAKVMDEYFRDVRAPNHVTVVHDRITFDRPDHAEPDHLVSNCQYLICIIQNCYTSYFDFAMLVCHIHS